MQYHAGEGVILQAESKELRHEITLKKARTMAKKRVVKEGKNSRLGKVLTYEDIVKACLRQRDEQDDATRKKTWIKAGKEVVAIFKELNKSHLQWLKASAKASTLKARIAARLKRLNIPAIHYK